MMTPYDSIPIEVRRDRSGWFGQAWPSGVCYDDDGRLLEELRKPFPAGESCLFCEEPFADGDSGQAMGRGHHAHKECMLMNVIGSLAHHEGRCRCHGGTGETPGMTVREEALEVWRRLQAGELFR